MKFKYLTTVFLVINLLIPDLTISASPSSCQSTVNNVIRQIKKKGVKKVQYSVNPEFYPQGAGLVSPIGNNYLSFDLSYNQKAVDTLNSGSLMRSWAIKIFK